MGNINIMDIEISRNEDGTLKIWFVAMAGEHGPIINLPDSLVNSLLHKLTDFISKGTKTTK
jgi:hypothetical protein